MWTLFNRYKLFTVRSWEREATLKISSFLILAVTYALTIFLVESAFNFKSILSQWGDSPRLTVYLSEGQTLKSQNKIKDDLTSIAEVSSVKFISEEQALTEFSSKNSVYSGDFLKSLQEQNVFTSSYEVTLKGDLKSNEYLSVMGGLSEKIKKFLGVDEVSYGQGWVERYSAFLRFSNTLIFVIISLLVIATLLIISNLTRVLIYNYKEEIEILELIGETAKNIRFPFICEGIVMSTISFLFGLIITFSTFNWLQVEMSKSSMLSHLQEIVAEPSFLFIFLGLFLSISFGAFSSFMTARSLNTGWSMSKRSN